MPQVEFTSGHGTGNQFGTDSTPSIGTSWTAQFEDSTMATTSASPPAPKTPAPADNITPGQRMISATAGNVLTGLLVTPLDVVRVRLQSQSQVHNTSPFTSHTTQTLKNLPPNLGITSCCREVFWVGNDAQMCMLGPQATAVGTHPHPAIDCAVEETQRRTFTSTLDGLRKIARNEGTLTLWRGLSPTLMMGIPANVIYFAGYDWLRADDRSPIKQRVSEGYAPLVAGSLARVAAAAATSPLEMFRTRLQATPGTGAGHFKTTVEDLYHMTQAKGYSSLWRGFTLTMWRDVPFSGLYWWGYEEVKKALIAARQKAPHLASSDHEPEESSLQAFLDSFISGGVSGSLAALVTTPFDVGKTRQQVFRHLDDIPSSVAPRTALPPGGLAAEQLSLPKFLMHIFREEGTAGLFRGWTARCLKVAPACAIMISTYELGKRMARERRPWFEPIAVAKDTNVDIVAVPPIGAHHRKTWIAHGEKSSWLELELLQHIPRARVLLYNYGDLRDDKIDTLGERLLNQLRTERKNEPTRRPIFLICHSTGGLVVKAALALASREPSQSILTSCHGIAFFATPHQGSTYLSADEYTASIRHLLHLQHDTPAALRKQLRPREERLWHLSNQFKTLSADMRVWSFLETVDSTMRVIDAETNKTLEFHVPITSIRSGLLDIENEKELPMATDHTGTATFHGQDSTRDRFLNELGDAVETAVEISKREDTPLGVEQQVMVQINGFFEDTALGVSDESPLKLWSTKVSLEDYLSRGPSACLRERLGRVQPSGLDDSSISSYDSPRSSYIAPASDPHHHHDHDDERPKPLRPPLPYRRSFDDPSGPSIHVTEADKDYPNEVPSESSPPSQEPKRKSSLTKALGFFPLTRSHRRSTSDSSSQGSIERPPSSASASQPVQSPFLAIPKSTRDRISQNADVADIPRAVPRFDRPEADTEKLMWIHVPYTHTGWVSQVIRRACQDSQEPNFVRKFINDENWYHRLNRARHLEPHARFVKPACIHSRQMDVSLSPSSNATEDPQLALYSPYLHWDTYRNLIQRRKVVEDRLSQGRSRPVPGRISKASLEAQLIWTYLGCEPPVHFRRTLDQYGYPNLRSTIARDDDQMLWKRTRRPARIDEQLKEYLRSAQDDPENDEMSEFMDGNVLMVDQLWLWIVDQKTVVTFFPNQEANTSEGKLFEQSNLHSSIYNELNGDLSRRFETAGDLAALIMLHSVTVLLDKTLHHDLQVLRIFEESISILTESVTKSFKRFRNRGFTNRPADHDRTSDGKIMTIAQQEYKEFQVARRNREDLSVLLELRDIEDELSTILKLLDQQDGVIKSMIKYFDNRGGYGKSFLDTAQDRIDEYRSQISEMKESSHLAQKAVETLLDLKQKQANVDEAKMTRWQAEVAQTQSRAVMVFTIFSVVFLPLSFFTSLFGINAREWSGEQTNPTLGEMFEIAAPASFAIIFLSLFIAFSETLRDIVFKTHKIGVGLLKDFILHPIQSVLGSTTGKIPVHVVPEDSGLRKRFDEYLGYGRRNMQRDEDIWQRWQGGRIEGKEVKKGKYKVKPGIDRSRGEV
ncbi:Mitochondrial substrate/solute carrier [Penicillium griseofulvum]|uniref:Mitochondrial substrate/solute carrier n=1 Tax=Penicillium patulum TaxID=5078 RepID=A0A135LX05_PENPA|nr:Mitochondrial substrate/solute carrier [Penicillium griseofulvum]KXG53451.1 Mitochondrial substrate/solute carrier [Penicillium griseofulvum]